MQIIRDNLTDRPTETFETPTLNETTHIVRIPPDLGSDYPGTTWTFGVRWRITNAKTGKIACIAFFRGDENSEYADLDGKVCEGPIFCDRARGRLASALCADIDGNDPELSFRRNILKCLDSVAETVLLENVAV